MANYWQELGSGSTENYNSCTRFEDLKVIASHTPPYSLFRISPGGLRFVHLLHWFPDLLFFYEDCHMQVSCALHN